MSAKDDIRTLTFRGQTIRYRRTGRARPGVPPTVFVGGAFQDLESWTRFVRAFAPRTETVVVDLPGAGSSDLLPSDVGLDFLVESLGELFRALRLQPAYVVSASYGSPIAYRFCQLFPEHVARVCLAGIMKAIPDHKQADTAETVEFARRGQKEELCTAVLGGLLSQDPESDIERRSLAQRVLRSGIMAMDEPALQRYASNTERLLRAEPLDLSEPPTVPAIVFTGEHDVYTTPEYCREIADALPASRFHVIERADHLFHIERFDATLELIMEFFLEGVVDEALAA